MKATFKFLSTLSFLTLVLVVATTSAAAQLNSNVGTITLNATLPESLTVSITGGATVNFTLAANTASNAGSTTSTVQTAWVLQPGRTQVTIWAWVPNGAAALTAGGAMNSVASGGAGVPAFITPAAATGVQIGSIAITGLNKASSTTTTLTWNINTTSTPQLPAGTYTGTVNIQAQATP